MNLKRILSVIIALAMVIGTMGFTAFAEEITATSENELKTTLAVGGTVVLGNDIMVSSQIDIPTGVTAVLDLSGHKITSGYQENSNTKHIYPISNNGVLTIIDSSEEKTGSISGRGIYNQNGGVLTLTDVKVTAEDWNGGACIWAYDTAKTYLNNCTMIGNTGVVSSEGYLEINGGTYTCYSGVDDDGNQITSPTYNIRAYNGLKITDGTFTSRHGVISLGGGEGVIEKGTFTVESVAKITSNVVYVKDNAELTIKNGSFTFANDNGDSGAAVLVEGDEASVSIDGGTFVGLNGMVSINDNTVINGGSFNTLWDYNHYGSIESAVALGATVTVAGTDMTKTENGLETLPAWDGVTIASLKDLKAFRDAVNAGDTYAGKTVTLTADIDLANEEWTPISSFSGTFVGGNHKISNLKITHPGTQTVVDNVGLFGEIKEGTIKDLVIENVNITGSGRVAAVAGNAYTGSISNVTVQGNIKIAAYQYVGGIGGYGYAKIENCHINGDGVETSVIKKVAKTEIFGDGTNGYVGGIKGFSGEGNTAVTNCSVKNITITTNDDTVGGISGIFHYGNAYTGCSLENVTITAPMNNDLNGIIAGDTRTESESKNIYDVTVKNVTATAEGANLPALGALAVKQRAGAMIDNSTDGNLSGTVYTTLTDAVADAESGDTITLLKTATDTVTIPEGVTLNKNGFTADNVIVPGPAWDGVTISTADDLKAFAEAVNAGDTYEGKIVTLADDIDLECSAVVIGTKANPFKGTFDGQGHTISNLSIYEIGSEGEYLADTDDCVGLFGVINSPAVIKNVTVYNPYIVGCAYVGGIVGQAYSGAIENCHVTGEIDIEGHYMVGGITGQGYASIKDCSVIGAPDWDYNYIGSTHLKADREGDNVGGIVGQKAESNTSKVSGCRVENVTVEGTRKVGGVIGQTFMNVDVVNCSAKNVTVKTNATADYAAANATSMSIGGIVGHYRSYGDNAGMLAENTVENITLVDTNNVGAAMGYITGGLKGETALVDVVDTMTVAANLINGENTGYTVEFANNPDGDYADEWNYGTDSGCYGDKSVAMMRFLFALGITDAIDVEKSGIKYIAGNDISAEVKGTSDTGASKAFYGDVIDVPEAEAGNTYYAVAYITTVTGKTYWSNPLGCTVNFDKFFSAYNGGNN